MKNVVVRISTPVLHTATVYFAMHARSLAPPLSLNAVRQILKDTGSQFLPPVVAIEELAKQLGNCEFWLDYVSRPSEWERRSQRLALLQYLQKMAEKMSASLTARSSAQWRNEDKGLRDSAKLLLENIRSQLNEVRNAGLPTSKQAWLVGAHLREIYEIFIQLPAGISRSRNEGHAPTGPYLRFARSTLQALNARNLKSPLYSDESILRAFSTNNSLAAKAA
jgi:hypothetical protein